MPLAPHFVSPFSKHQQRVIQHAVRTANPTMRNAMLRSVKKR